MIIIILNILFLLIMVAISVGLYLLNDKIDNVYDMQVKFNNVERARTELAERNSQERLEQIKKLENELEFRDEAIAISNENYTKLYEGIEKLAKTIKDKIK